MVQVQVCTELSVGKSVCYDWLLSKTREAYEDEQGHRQALVQRERSKARQSGWRQDVLSK